MVKRYNSHLYPIVKECEDGGLHTKHIRAEIWEEFCMCTQLLSHVWIVLYDPMDWSPPGSSVHGISQTRLLKSVAMPSSRGSSPPRTEPLFPTWQTHVFTHWATREAPEWCGIILSLKCTGHGLDSVLPRSSLDSLGYSWTTGRPPALVGTLNPTLRVK